MLALLELTLLALSDSSRSRDVLLRVARVRFRPELLIIRDSVCCVRPSLLPLARPRPAEDLVSRLGNADSRR